MCHSLIVLDNGYVYIVSIRSVPNNIHQSENLEINKLYYM